MSSSLLTRPRFQAVEQTPSVAQEPRNKMPILITSWVTTSRFHDQERSPHQQQSFSWKKRGWLTAFREQDRIERFKEAITDALQLSEIMVAADEADPIDFQTLIYASQSLAPLVKSLNLSPPLILPLQNGGIGVEWHTAGMNIELRFRKPYDIYAVLEDARNVIEPFHSRDPDLVHTQSALSELSTRSVE